MKKICFLAIALMCGLFCYAQIAETIEITAANARIVEKTVWREHKPSTEQPTTARPTVSSVNKQEEPACTSVSCDGINYGILASN